MKVFTFKTYVLIKILRNIIEQKLNTDSIDIFIFSNQNAYL